MKPLIKLKTTTLVLTPLVLACFALLPSAQALTTDPDETFPNFTTAAGLEALLNVTTGGSNTAYGARALKANTTGGSNTAIGGFALINNIDGNFNGAQGNNALFNNTHGSSNMAVGQAALSGNIDGNSNVGIGFQAFNRTQHTSNNVGIGFQAGINYPTTSTANDITAIASPGDGSNFDASNRTFIGNIRGITVGNGDGIAVIIDSDGQLGTTNSSRRFKDDIELLDHKTSEAIMALKPVTFHYKGVDSKKAHGTPQYGLIAEDVAKVIPDLVVRDKDGQPLSVRYDAVNVMLLNEFLSEHKKVQELEGTVATLAATVKEQAAQIQKVSAQVQMNKPTPKVVANNP